MACIGRRAQADSECDSMIIRGLSGRGLEIRRDAIAIVVAITVVVGSAQALIAVVATMSGNTFKLFRFRPVDVTRLAKD